MNPQPIMLRGIRDLFDKIVDEKGENNDDKDAGRRNGGDKHSPPSAPHSASGTGRRDTVDPFGLEKLNPTKAGGMEWHSKFNNGHARTLEGGVDPYDPWLDFSHGEGEYEIDGKGTLTATGPYVRIYVVSPDHQREWDENLEITGVLARVSEFGDAEDSYIQVFCRTNHGIDYDEDELLNDDRGYGAVFLYDGEWSFEKETAHHLDNGYAPAKGCGAYPLGGSFPAGAPVPFKYVVRNDAANTNTTLELWLGNAKSTDGSPWKKITSYTDTGDNWGHSCDACSSGVNPGLRLTRHLVLPSSPSGKPFLSVYFRNEKGTVAYGKLSILEIDPLP